MMANSKNINFCLNNKYTGDFNVFQPGELVWYESARLLHGRPDPFQGEYFDNLFIHYKPTHLWYTHQPDVREQLTFFMS